MHLAGEEIEQSVTPVRNILRDIFAHSVPNIRTRFTFLSPVPFGSISPIKRTSVKSSLWTSKSKVNKSNTIGELRHLGDCMGRNCITPPVISALRLSPDPSSPLPNSEPHSQRSTQTKPCTYLEEVLKKKYTSFYNEFITSQLDSEAKQRLDVLHYFGLANAAGESTLPGVPKTPNNTNSTNNRQMNKPFQLDLRKVLAHLNQSAVQCFGTNPSAHGCGGRKNQVIVQLRKGAQSNKVQTARNWTPEPAHRLILYSSDKLAPGASAQPRRDRLFTSDWRPHQSSSRTPSPGITRVRRSKISNSTAPEKIFGSDRWKYSSPKSSLSKKRFKTGRKTTPVKPN
ncbi:unnamed protein product [Echinostoma caproni]|uniref:Uncharacterized protein n=1 Tax=Echinostoma caproni TaxID=27848 RepID=A0A183AGD9_9TREM|nr:unnamed protein product [Echinostoma caproni]